MDGFRVAGFKPPLLDQVMSSAFLRAAMVQRLQLCQRPIRVQHACMQLLWSARPAALRVLLTLATRRACWLIILALFFPTVLD
jgi:hypothetical protein